MPEFSILGVKVAEGLTRPMLLEQVAEWVEAGQPRTISYVNAHCLNLAYQDAEYRRILNQADLVYPDGLGVVWAAKFLARRRMGKLTGADWIGDFCDYAVRHAWRVFLLGGREGVAQAAGQRLQAQHPGLQIVGTLSGFFNRGDEIPMIEKINQSKAQVLLVGLGVPRQEKWLAAHRAEIHAPVCWTVGALFDYIAGIERRVPAWLNVLGGEWAWRLAMDPRGKWRRYLLGNPVFAARVLREKWRNQSS